MAACCACAVATIYYNQPLLPQIAAAFGRDAAAQGLIATLTQMGYALGLALFVPLGDRMDARRVVLALVAVNMASLAACALAPAFGVLAAASLVLGSTAIASQLIIPAISGRVPVAARGRVVGALLSGMSAGLLLARSVSGVVGAHFGWRAMFGLATLLDLVLMLVVWRAFPPTRPATDLPYHALLRSALRLVRDEPVLRLAAASGFCMFGAFCALWASLALLLGRPPFGYGPDMVGAFGLLGIAGLLASPLVGRWADRIGPPRVVLAGAGLVALAFLCIAGAAWHLGCLLAGIVLLDIGNRCGLVGNQTRIYALRPEVRSRLNMVFMCCYFLGGALGSTLGTAAARHGGWGGLALVGMGLAGMAGLLQFVGRPRPAPGA